MALPLLVIHLLLFLLVQNWLLFLGSRLGKFFLVQSMLLDACGSSLSTLSGLLLALLSSFGFNFSLLLGSYALDCGNTLLSFSFDSEFGILLSFESGSFLSLLVTLLLLFLFLEHMFELLDGTSVLLGKLLEF